MLKSLAVLVLMLAMSATAGDSPTFVREVQIGEDVSFDGTLYSGRHTAAITVDMDGVVTVRIGAAFPLLRDGEGYFVRLTKVRVLR